MRQKGRFQRIPAQTEDENADKLKLNEYIDWLRIHAKRWGVRKAFLRYLNFTNTNDARRYQHFVKGGGANLVIDLLVAQPTPEKKFPEVVPILRECGNICEEGSPESPKDPIHIAHASEDQKGLRQRQNYLGDTPPTHLDQNHLG